MGPFHRIDGTMNRKVHIDLENVMLPYAKRPWSRLYLSAE